MANSKANFSLATYSSGNPFVPFDVAAGDTACSTFTVHNRDATNYVRVAVSGLIGATEDGAAVAPGATIPFHGANITKVSIWPESGSPSIDAFVEARV